ncbi:hypothetical protein ENUP19_0211G0035 [Entamoeba nuttalli]|uniref:Hexosyltransferase n=2 Tax=Entamoeba nuttalli TaxID=412467 RepID=K2H0P3_ENTNP|nr:hypothetical protein ENU1_113310 [Entamoeba nuttalli P19]EKE39817.1 hypothetical protein ENU1_113310 [Entamoeba nuttalli P19]|eukprot:XP_008857844.1 hypothetical protein ENU1_113310 [Entamoeba nuttalli P19]
MIIILLLFQLFSAKEYITQKQREYVTKFYGPKFKVEEDYPYEIDFNTYAHVEVQSKNPPRDEDRIYPKKLWLAIIHSIPSKISHVENTRNTWCREEYQQRYGFKCIFVFVESSAKQLEQYNELVEMNETYHDIYFIDMPDLNEHWFTLQQKNINAYIMALKLFPNYYFYTRVDDEIIVTVDLLSDFLFAHTHNPTVVGQLTYHAPYTNPRHKYYDPLSRNLPRYYIYPGGYLSIFSQDIIKFIGKWENYYTFAPSSLEDPGFGHWIYKFANTTNQRVDLLTPENWGGHVGTTYGDYIVFHDQEGHLNQLETLNRRIEDGYMKY